MVAGRLPDILETLSSSSSWKKKKQDSNEFFSDPFAMPFIHQFHDHLTHYKAQCKRKVNYCVRYSIDNKSRP